MGAQLEERHYAKSPNSAVQARPKASAQIDAAAAALRAQTSFARFVSHRVQPPLLARVPRSQLLHSATLGEKLGVTQQVITNWERNLREPNVETLLKIAGIFEITLEQLVGLKMVDVCEQTSRALQKRFELIKKLSPEKQKAFMTFVDALKV